MLLFVIPEIHFTRLWREGVDVGMSFIVCFVVYTCVLTAVENV
jgi:hypothetical protein